MACIGYRLQFKLANLTNHKFPMTGSRAFKVKCNILYVGMCNDGENNKLYNNSLAHGTVTN